MPILLFFLLSQSHGKSRRLRVSSRYGSAMLVKMGSATRGGALWEPSGLAITDVLASVPAVVQQIYVNLTGSYYLGFRFEPPGPISRILAYVWFGILAVTIVLQVYRLSLQEVPICGRICFLPRRPRHSSQHGCCLTRGTPGTCCP
jgi:hypothetical protein